MSPQARVYFRRVIRAAAFFLPSHFSFSPLFPPRLKPPAVPPSVFLRLSSDCLGERRAYCWAASFLKMTPKGLIYSFVAKGTVVLAEHTPYSGNFSTIAVQCLQKLPSSSSKYTYSCDGHTFSFLLDGGFVFLVVADESMGRSVPFVFLERVKDDFKQHYGDSIKSDGQHPLADDEDEDDDLFEDRFSIAYNLDREFGPKLKEHMQYCMNHPEEMNKLSKLKAQITEVKGIMMDNIEKVLDRGEKIELLVDKTENLQFQADSFQRQGRQLRRQMWLQTLRTRLMVGGGILILICLIWLMFG
ncbi:Vesicle-associated membrane protein 727 [Striga hermonthica]|uniref:Vesicle-associated membrane protein 727 n=1 Tax=Striga hermonthica TaxID=68872 RepID=A0A9N7MMH9_STRHE|nr:Vesicle-associated membrane protein 727 [Striga hermonthica]